MRVVLINHSDVRGGASVVTFRLMEALRNAGVDARMIVMHKASDTHYVRLVQPAWLRKACFLYEHEYIFAHNGFSRDTLFKISVANCGMPLHKHPWVERADVVCLNWINQGMLSLREISRIKAPVVWTMHDMWCLTGICHHAGTCDEYTANCEKCPMLINAISDKHLASATHKRKRQLYSNKKIHFVAVSSWLAKKCAKSSLLGREEVSVIPNAFPVENFTNKPVRGRNVYGLPEGKKLIVMGAARLDDPIKGLDIAIDALNALERDDVAAVFYGDIRHRDLLDNLKVPYVCLGTISHDTTLHDIYAHASVVISTSHYETLPGTLIEGMASGCVPVSFSHGGQTDIFDHKVTGYIAQYPDPMDIAEGIRWALDSPPSYGAMREEVIKRFGAVNVALHYIELFDNIVKNE